MPICKAGGGEVVLFRVPFPKGKHFLSKEDIDAAHNGLRLKPAPPYVLIALNAADCAFADAYPNITSWVCNSKVPKTRYIACAKLDGVRDVSVGTCETHMFQDFWYFVGIES